MCEVNPKAEGGVPLAVLFQGGGVRLSLQLWMPSEKMLEIVQPSLPLPQLAGPITFAAYQCGIWLGL